MTTASTLLRTGKIEPPVTLLPALLEIERMVQSTSASEAESLRSNQFRDSGESLISILGKRGSGKTTILAAACASLEQSGSALVLPIIRPEIFEATDSLLLAMLLEVENWLTAAEPPTRESLDQPTDVGGALADAMRSVSTSSRGAYIALTASSESTGQYGVDAVAIVRHRSRLSTSLAQLFAALRQNFECAANAPIVVPIDDADMSPASLRSIITAVRILGSIGGVIPIICADRRQLEFATLADIHQQYGGHINDLAAERLATQVVAKLLRPERCITPPVLPERDRIKFAPIGEDLTIEQLLHEVSRAVRLTESLQSLIWNESEITRSLQPRAVNAWLPDTPRELEYLWQSIMSLKETSRHPDIAIRAQQVQRFVDQVLASSREFEISVEVLEASKRRRSRAGASIMLRWPSMNYAVTADSRYTSATTNKDLRVRLRRLNMISAAIFPTTADPNKAASQDSQRALSATAVSSMEALQTLAVSGFLGECQPAPSHIGEQSFEFLQLFTINGERTDDLFLSMPDSCGMSAITRAAVAWNRLVEDARNFNRDRNGATAIVRRFIQLVIGYWLLGDTRILTTRKLPAMERSLELCSLEYLKRVSDDDVSHHDDYSIGRAYCHWFERRLPYLFHSVVLGTRKDEAAVDRWLDAISAGPRAVEATGELRSAMEARFARQFDEERRRKLGENSWIYGYHVLARNIGTELYADMLLLKDAYEERRRSRVVGHDILGDSVGLSVVKGPYEYAPHRTVEGDEEMGVLREVLEQYRSR